MERHQRFSNRFFLLGLGLLSLIVYSLLLAAIAYIRGQVMNAYIFPIAIAMTGITQFFAAKALFPDKAPKVFFQGLFSLLAITGIAIWVSGAIYDVSSKGQWLHQETIRRLKTGWNPYLKYLEAPEIQIGSAETAASCAGPDTSSDSSLISIPDPKYQLINYQPKAVEIVAASIYAVTGQLETGKAVNLLAFLGTLFLCLAWLYGRQNISVGKKWLLAVLAAANPVTLTLLPTFRTEGTLLALCMSLLVCTLLIAGSVGRYRVYLFGLLLIFCLNIRPMGWVFPTIIAAGFLLFLFIKKDRGNMKTIFYACLLSAAVGLIFIGFHPYVTNFISGESSAFTGKPLNPAPVTGRVVEAWGRYALPLWCVLLAALLILDRMRTAVSRRIRLFLYASLTLNVLCAVFALIVSLLLSARADHQIRQMKALNEPVLIEFCAYRNFESNEWRLQENNIPFNIGKVTGGHIENIVCSTTRFQTEDPLPELPKSLFVRWAEKIPVYTGY